MKKEYFALIGLILILGAYLFLRTENRDNYTLPEIKKIDISQATGIILEKKEGIVEFVKKENRWRVGKDEFLADGPAVEDMLDTFKGFKLSALVSQTKDLKRYDLDDENMILVKLLNKDSTLFEFTLGKVAPTYNHTFVMLSGDDNVYHANGSFRTDFDKNVDDFRDKTVLEFKEGNIKQFTIEKDGLTKALIAKEEIKDDKTTITWTDVDGKAVEKDAVENLLSAASLLKCEKFLDDAAKDILTATPFLCKIKLNNDKAIDLTLFRADKEAPLKGISSMSNFAFELGRFNGNEIVTNIDKLLGINDNKETK